MTYTAEQFRKVLKAEQAAYIEQAITLARTAPATYEGSLDPTGSVEFFHLTTHAALEHYADLKADGWTLEHTAPVFYNNLHSFVAIKPDHVFELDKALIAARAEKAYVKEVEDHNKEAQRLKDKATFVEAEFQRIESERKAALRAELESQYENRGRIQRVNSTDVKLHA